jgi:hypothetical protein
MTTTYQHFWMLVCGSLSSVFVREKCWYVVVIALCLVLQTQSYDYHIPTFLPCKHRVMTTTYQHFCLTKTELWLPHTKISLLQTQSYDYYSKREMLVCGSHSSVFVREKCWYVVVIALFVREKCWYVVVLALFVRENCWYVVVIALCL